MVGAGQRAGHELPDLQVFIEREPLVHHLGFGFDLGQGIAEKVGPDRPVARQRTRGGGCQQSPGTHQNAGRLFLDQRFERFGSAIPGADG